MCWVVGCVFFVNIGGGGLRLSYGIELDFILDRWSNHFSRGFLYFNSFDLIFVQHGCFSRYKYDSSLVCRS